MCNKVVAVANTRVQRRRIRHKPTALVTDGRLSLMDMMTMPIAVLAVSLALLLLPSCAGSVVGTLAPTMAPVADIREQIVTALDRPGLFAQIRTVMREPDGPQGLEEVTVTWLDISGRRARREEKSGQSLGRVTIIAQDSQLTYYRDADELYESRAVMPPDWINKFPPALHNPVLMGIGPLTMALYGDPWESIGTGAWEGHSASVWKAKHLGPDSTIGLTTIYLDPETNLPLGQDLAFTQREGEPVQVSYSVTYQIDFVSPEALAQRVFDFETLRELNADFGGKLKEAAGLGLAVLWLGREAHVGDAYPMMTLQNIRLQPPGHPDGASASFTYSFRDARHPPEVRGTIHVLVWPRSNWESTAEARAGSAAWWHSPSVQREPITIADLRGEYAIGYLPPPERTRPDNAPPDYTPPPPRINTEAIVWLPDSVVRLGTGPAWMPRTPGPSAAHETPVIVSPDLDQFVDMNPFNSPDGLRSILKALVPLQ